LVPVALQKRKGIRRRCPGFRVERTSVQDLPAGICPDNAGGVAAAACFVFPVIVIALIVYRMITFSVCYENRRQASTRRRFLFILLDLFF
jgi:hypothetical protein